MDLLQLKMPPDKAGKLADALDRYLQADVLQPDHDELNDILIWLRYRVARWNKNHPAVPVA